jgi:hypothetical protein
MFRSSARISRSLREGLKARCSRLGWTLFTLVRLLRLLNSVMSSLIRESTLNEGRQRYPLILSQQEPFLYSGDLPEQAIDELDLVWFRQLELVCSGS